MKGRASRRNLLTFALLGLCAAFAVLALLPPPAPVPEAVRQTAAAVAFDGDGAVEAVARPRSQTGDGPAFQRPIFLPSRRLPGSSSATVGSLKLRAVFLGPGMKKALVESTPGEEAVWVTAGQDVAGWQVVDIDAESVVLTGRNGRRTLQLEKPRTEAVVRTRALQKQK